MPDVLRIGTRVAVVGLLMTCLGLAQVTTATFFGIVHDPTGAVIPGAEVSFKHQDTGSVTTKTTDSAGEFQFDFLRVGSYTLTIQASGFKRYEGSGIELAASQRIRQSFALDVPP